MFSTNKGFGQRLKSWIIKHTLADWVFLLILGIVMALLSFAMDFSIVTCQKAQYSLFKKLNGRIFLQYLAWVSFPFLFISFAVLFVHIVSQQAIGSGIPQMKTILRGVVLHKYLSFRTLVAKVVGLTTSVGSRLPIGKEGPFVHIASIIASLLHRWVSYFKSPYHYQAHRSEMLAAACAVGVACNFAAPIGGVLFSIEVTATYFAVRDYWRGFFGAVCGAFAFRLLAVWNRDEETITALFKTNFRVEFPFDLQELFGFTLIGILCGFAGALFVYLHKIIVEWRERKNRFNNFMAKNMLLYPAFLSILISSITFPLGLGQFMAGELTLKEAVDALFDNKTWGKLGYIDESEVLPVDAQEAWKHPRVNIYITLTVFICVQFMTTALSLTLPVPSGVFMPVFVIGAAFGRLVGEATAALFPSGFHSGELLFRIVPGGYAVVGAASLAGAVTHTVSTAVIVFELTGQIAHILPVMIAVLIANVIAQRLQPSIYESIIQIKALPYLPDMVKGKQILYSLNVEKFMKKDILYITYSSTKDEIKKSLNETLDMFPLVDGRNNMVLLGAISRKDLEECLIKTSNHTHILLEQNDVTKHSANADLNSINHNSSNNHEDGDLSSNLHNIAIDPAPFQVQEGTSLHMMHAMFALLDINSAFVTSCGRLVGMITLKEMRSAIEKVSKLRTKHIQYNASNVNSLIQYSELRDNESDDDTVEHE